MLAPSDGSGQRWSLDEHAATTTVSSVMSVQLDPGAFAKALHAATSAVGGSAAVAGALEAFAVDRADLPQRGAARLAAVALAADTVIDRLIAGDEQIAEQILAAQLAAAPAAVRFSGGRRAE